MARMAPPSPLAARLPGPLTGIEIVASTHHRSPLERCWKIGCTAERIRERVVRFI